MIKIKQRMKTRCASFFMGKKRTWSPWVDYKVSSTLEDAREVFRTLQPQIWTEYAIFQGNRIIDRKKDDPDVQAVRKAG